MVDKTSVSFVAANNSTGDFVVAGVAAVQQPERSGVLSGRLYDYYAVTADGLSWEKGSGVYTIGAPSVQARTNIVANSARTSTRLDFPSPPTVSLFPSELSRAEPMGVAVLLGSNVDFNTVTGSGEYFTQDINSTNVPPLVGTVHWYLKVEGYVNIGGCKQTATMLSSTDSRTYIRNLVAGSGWAPWHQVTFAATALAASQDFNLVVTPGFYYTIDATPVNAPSTNSFYLLVETYQTNQFVKQTATLLAQFTPTTYVRTMTGSFWGPWHQTSVVDTTLPVGTSMIFIQTAAPVGWTKITSHNDKLLRIVSGSASVGGSNAFSTVMAQTTVGNHTVVTGEMPSHNHVPAGANHLFAVFDSAAGGAYDISVVGTVLTTDNVANTGGGGAHNHPLTMDILYVDCIICQKV